MDGTISDRKLAAILVGLALLMRMVLYLGTFMFGADGGWFLFMADNLSLGNADEALRTGYHPFYPFLISLGKPVFGAETSGFWISILLGASASAPLYLLARSVFNRSTAFFGTLLYIFHPLIVREQVDVMTGGTFLFFAFSAVWLGGKIIDRPKWWLAILAGASAGAAFLTRPEGLLFVAGIAAWSGFFFWRSQRFSRILCMILALGASTAVAAPYLQWIKNEVGSYSLSIKTSVTRPGNETENPPSTSPEESGHTEEKSGEKPNLPVTGEPAANIPGQESSRQPEKPPPSPSHWNTIAKQILKISYGATLPLLLIGLFAAPRNWKTLYFVSFPVLYWAGLLVYNPEHASASHRYWMHGYSLFLPLVALGLFRVLQWIRRPGWLPAVMLLVLAASVAKNLRPNRYDMRPAREAAAWIRETGVSSPRIITQNHNLSYLAGGTNIDFAPDWEQFRHQLKEADFVVFRGKYLRKKSPPYLQRVEEQLGKPRIFEQQGKGSVHVFRCLPAVPGKSRVPGPGSK